MSRQHKISVSLDDTEAAYVAALAMRLKESRGCVMRTALADLAAKHNIGLATIDIPAAKQPAPAPSWAMSIAEMAHGAHRRYLAMTDARSTAIHDVERDARIIVRVVENDGIPAPQLESLIHWIFGDTDANRGRFHWGAVLGSVRNWRNVGGVDKKIVTAYNQWRTCINNAEQTDQRGSSNDEYYGNNRSRDTSGIFDRMRASQGRTDSKQVAARTEIEAPKWLTELPDDAIILDDKIIIDGKEQSRDE